MHTSSLKLSDFFTHYLFQVRTPSLGTNTVLSPFLVHKSILSCMLLYILTLDPVFGSRCLNIQFTYPPLLLKYLSQLKFTYSFNIQFIFPYPLKFPYFSLFWFTYPPTIQCTSPSYFYFRFHSVILLTFTFTLSFTYPFTPILNFPCTPPLS